MRLLSSSSSLMRGLWTLLITLSSVQAQTILQILQDTPLVFSTLTSAIDAAPEVASVLSSLDSNKTLFAPNNDAVAAVDLTVLTRFLTNAEWSEHLFCILASHASGVGGVLSSDVNDGDSVDSLYPGNSLDFTLLPPAPLEVNGVSVDVDNIDIEATNGVIHALQEVLTPDCGFTSILGIINTDPEFTIMARLLNATEGTRALAATYLDEIVNVDSGVTFFATLDSGIESTGAAEQLAGIWDNPDNAPYTEALAAYHFVRGNQLEYQEGFELDAFVALNQWGDAMYAQWHDILNDGTLYPGYTTLRLTENAEEEIILASNGAIWKGQDPFVLLSAMELPGPRPDLTFMISFLGRTGNRARFGFNIFDPMQIQPKTILLLQDEYCFSNQIICQKLGACTSRNPLVPWTTHCNDFFAKHYVTDYVPSRDIIAAEGPVFGPRLLGSALALELTDAGIVQAGTTMTATVVEPDLFAWDGVAHIVDGPVDSEWIQKSIWDLLQESQEFSVVRNLINQIPQLKTVLQDTGSNTAITFFAPVNAAFTEVLDPTLEELTDILFYHLYTEVIQVQLYDLGLDILPQAYTASFTTNELKSILDKEVSGGTEVQLTTYTMNNAKLLEVDVLAVNGLLQKIDAVLVEPAPTPSPSMVPTATASPVSPSASPSTTPSTAPTPQPVNPPTNSPTPAPIGILVTGPPTPFPTASQAPSTSPSSSSTRIAEGISMMSIGVTAVVAWIVTLM